MIHQRKEAFLTSIIEEVKPQHRCNFIYLKQAKLIYNRVNQIELYRRMEEKRILTAEKLNLLKFSHVIMKVTYSA